MFSNNFVFSSSLIALAHGIKWAIFVKWSTHISIESKPHDRGKLIIKSIEMEDCDFFGIESSSKRLYGWCKRFFDIKQILEE